MSYSDLFTWSTFLEAFATPTGLGLIASLIVIEGLLSADNALVLAGLANKLPEKQKRKALLYGLWGAYIFRIIAIGVGVYLVQYSWVKYVGAAYLLWIAGKFFYDKIKESNDSEDAEKEEKDPSKGFLAKLGISLFVRTIIAIELMDIAFSIDSILAAFAVSSNPWILITGGLLGILAMRLLAGVIMKLMEKVSTLEPAAFVLIGIIGIKMILDTAGIFHMSHEMFFVVLLAVFAVAYVFHLKNKKAANKTA